MPQIFGVTRRDRPTKQADGVQQQLRLGGYGDQYQIPMSAGHYGIADEGSYWKATNPTPGTAIAHATTAAFSATAALFCLRNTDAEGAKRLYLDYVKLITVGTPTTATSAQMAMTIDNTNRFSSGGSAITPVNVNMDSALGTIAALNFGAVVLTAASGSVRLVARHTFKTQATPCLAVGDVIIADFGTFQGQHSVQNGATAQALPGSFGPVILGGGDSLNFHLYYPAVTAAPTFEFEIGYWER